MTLSLDYDRLSSFPLPTPFEDLEIPQSAKEIEELEAQLLRDGEQLRKMSDVEPKAKQAIIDKLVDGVVCLTASNAEDYRKVIVATEIAADVSVVVDTPTPVVQIAHELIDERYSEPTSNRYIDKMNEEAREALILAIHETDRTTPFSEALAESTVEVDQQYGRSFSRDVIEPTSIAVTVKEEQRQQARLRQQRAAEAHANGKFDLEDDDTIAVDMSQFLDDDCEDEAIEQPFDRKKAEKYVSFTTFRSVLADEDHERVATAKELAQIRSDIDASYRQAS